VGKSNPAWQKSNFSPAPYGALQNRLNMGGVGGGASAFAKPIMATFTLLNRSTTHQKPVVPDSKHSTRQAPLAYEYNIEIAFLSKQPPITPLI